MTQGKSLSHQSTLRQTVFGLSLLLLCFCAPPSFAQIVTAVHANWDPDLTDANPSICATSGTVANPTLHFVAARRYPVSSVSVDWMRVDEQPEQHVPLNPQFDNPPGSTGSPPACASSLVSDPTQWTWTIWTLPDSVVGTALHNTTYTVTVQYRYYYVFAPPYYYGGAEGPFQQSITVNLQNLVVSSSDECKMLKWVPDRPTACDAAFNYALSCVQRKWSQVTISIYSTDKQKIYETIRQVLCPGGYTFTWDGTQNVGGSGTAPAGLYTFNIVAQGAYPNDADDLRSRALTITELRGCLKRGKMVA